MVIDDDTATQELLRRVLKKQGYEVTVASNGEEGFERAKVLQPALIICDWVMPQLTGIEVCRRIKASSDLSTTFFILLTSLGGVEERVKGLDAGADEDDDDDDVVLVVRLLSANFSSTPRRRCSFSF